MARTSNFANVATVTRASTKTDAGGWDFTNGGTVGTLTEYASGVAAIHPTAGLLVEEDSTNEIRNPRCEGASAGTPGTLPTNWSVSNGGMTTSVVGAGTEDGWPYLEVSLSGTASSDCRFEFDAAGQIVAAIGESWTLSFGVKVVSGSLPGTPTLGMIERDGSNAIQAIGLSPAISPGSSHQRFHFTRTMTGATTASVVPSFFLDNPSGAVSCTFRIYAPQMEEKSYPTSPVFPVVSSPAAATRARDQVSIALPSAFFSNDGGTVYVDMTAGPERDDSARQVAWAWYLSSSRRLYPYIINPGNQWRLFAFDGADVIPATTGYILSAGLSRHRMAVYLSDANIKWAINGAGGSTENYSITPTATLAIDDYTSFIIGSSLNTRCLNGYIKEIRYWPKELSNAEMAALVGL